MTDQADYQQNARDIIERMKTARPTCEHCFELEGSYAAGACMFSLARRSITNHECDAFMESHGFEQQPHRDAWVRRCEACASGRSFPWADQLDVDKVADYLANDARCQMAFELSLLHETIEDKPPLRSIHFCIACRKPPPIFSRLHEGKCFNCTVDVSGATVEAFIGTAQGCKTGCIRCGAQVPDLGPLKTPYYCAKCHADEPKMSPVQPCEQCGHEHRFSGCVCGCDMWTKQPDGHFKFPVRLNREQGTDTPSSGTAFAISCPDCGKPDCTTNHRKYT